MTVTPQKVNPYDLRTPAEKQHDEKLRFHKDAHGWPFDLFPDECCFCLMEIQTEEMNAAEQDGE
jgi:hypothetical protein